MALPDLLQWLDQGRKTGTVTLQNESLIKRLFVQLGDIISAGSNDPREFLGQIMVSQQLITETQLKEAFDIQEKTRVMLGRVLVEKNWVTEETITRALRRKTEETVYSLFLWEGGEFEYREGEVSAAEGIRISLKIEEVLLEGLRRFDLAQQIRRTFPNDQIVLRRTQSKPSAAISENRFAVRTLGLVDGVRTLQDLCLELHAPEFTVSYFLLSALEKGYVEIASTGEGPVGSQMDTYGEEQVRQARELIRSGAYAEALEVFERLGDGTNLPPEVARLVKVAEVNLVDRLYGGPLPPKHIPILTRPLDSLVHENLTPEEVFLVSRVNGSWDLKSIISISPLREIDALRVVKNLRERGILELKES